MQDVSSNVLLLLGILQSSSRIELEEDDVTILHSVISSLLPILASRFSVRLGTLLLEVLKVHHLRHDETLLKIRVNAACRLRCFRALLDGPGFHFVRTGSEEVLQLQRLVTGQDDLLQVGGRFVVFGVFLSQRIVLKICPVVLKDAREGNDGRTGIVLVHPVLDLGQPLVLLADVVGLRQIHQIDDGLRGQEQVLVQNIDLEGMSGDRSKVTCAN